MTPTSSAMSIVPRDGVTVVMSQNSWSNFQEVSLTTTQLDVFSLLIDAVLCVLSYERTHASSAGPVCSTLKDVFFFPSGIEASSR